MSASHLPLDKQFHEATVAAANAAETVEPKIPAANEDEINQITLGKDPLQNLTPTNQPKKLDDKANFGLPAPGAFSDPHDSQRQEPFEGSQRQESFDGRKASISTQKDFSEPDVLQQSSSGGNISSFEPTTSGETAKPSSNTGD
jgi:hypothetical protein